MKRIFLAVLMLFAVSVFAQETKKPEEAKKAPEVAQPAPTQPENAIIPIEGAYKQRLQLALNQINEANTALGKANSEALALMAKAQVPLAQANAAQISGREAGEAAQKAFDEFLVSKGLLTNGEWILDPRTFSVVRNPNFKKP